MKITSLLFFLVTLFLFSCSSVKKTNVTHFPVKKEVFLEKPFGFESNIKNFREKLLPRFKEQQYVMHNQHYPKQMDTIVKFINGTSELFIYKTAFKRELFIGGNVTSPKVVFCNGINVGMQRGAFFNCFSDLQFTDEDTVKVKSLSPGVGCNFVFKNDKLTKVNLKYNYD